MKESYNYETKSKAREELRKFIEEIYPKRKKRRNLKVLTLLGHEDNELREVWDRLGILEKISQT